jgi:biopolymer transport protein ExbD
MNAAQVRAKARMAMKRREEEIETEEMEGGELNLVPYLDIVTNVMLFLLATVTSGLLLGNINTALPEYAPAGTQAAQTQTTDLAEPPLEMTVVIGRDKILFFSNKGLEGSLDQPLLEVPAIKPGLEYNFAMLTASAQAVVSKHFKGRFPLGVDDKDKSKPVCRDTTSGKPSEWKVLPLSACRPQGATEVIMAVDPTIPYHVVTRAMDALRSNDAKDAKGQLVVPYPDNILFPDVLFATGVKNQ